MSDKITDWLLEESDPSIRFFTLTSLLDKPEHDPLVIKARKDIMEKGIIPKIIENQNSDGSWSIPEKFYTDKYKGTVWTLLIFAELAANPDDARIKKACEFILTHSQDPESGGFSVNQSVKTFTGLPSFVIPCLTGNMVYSLIKLGFKDDKRVLRAIDWIVQYQRADDGLAIPLTGKFYKRLEICFGRHSCHMGVAKTLKALASLPADKRSSQVTEKMNELIEYFLKHHLYKKSHHLDEISRPGWLKLGFPLMYQTDILELSEILVGLNIRDPRMQDAIDIIIKKQSKEGFWNLENTFNGKMMENIEKKGLPSKWITLKARKVLKYYSS